MKIFHMIRANRSTMVMELSFWDIAKLLWGREILLLEKGESIVLRHKTAYELLNMAAPRAE